MSQIRKISVLAGLLLAGLFLVVGCGSSGKGIFDPETGHPTDWIKTHGEASIENPDGCTSCHGPDLDGGIAEVGCFAASFNGTACHGSLAFHGQGWSAPDQHGASAKAAPGSSGFASCQTCHGHGFDGGIIRTSCFTCHGVAAPHPPAPWRGSQRTHTNTDVNNAPVCALCHLGASGVQVPPGTPPGCFNSTLCHGAAGSHPANWVDTHGAAAINDPDSCTACHGSDLGGGTSGVGCFAASFNGTSCHGSGAFHGQGWSAPDQHGASAKAAPGSSGFASCQTCHGHGFDGGIIRTSCFTCHGVDAPHPPAPWRGSQRTHTSTNVNNAEVCALCHLGDSGVQVPQGTPPGCFNNTLCHASAGAPHPVPFTDPSAHGPAAKADLIFCQDCHANPSQGGPGSNPRFNVAIGSLSAGCEDCHNTNTAHPVPWLAPAPTGHQNAGNMPDACALCHGANLGGGTGPACSVCHTAGSPLTATGCTSCHGNPPSGTVTPNREGAHTEHNALLHVTGACSTCHSGAGTGTSSHFNGSTEVAFLSTYNAKSGPATHNANGTCSSVSCHGAQTTPDWLTGSINVNTACASCHRSRNASDQYNSYFSGRHSQHIGEGISCTECHDTAKLSAVHFTDLNTTAMNEAGLTIIDAANYTGSTCTITCHGESHNNESW